MFTNVTTNLLGEGNMTLITYECHERMYCAQPSGMSSESVGIKLVVHNMFYWKGKVAIVIEGVTTTPEPIQSEPASIQKVQPETDTQNRWDESGCRTVVENLVR